MLISKHFGHKAIFQLSSTRKPVRKVLARASTSGSLFSGQAVHLVAEAFANRLQHLSLLHPAVTQLDFSGVEIVSVPPGYFVFSLNKGEAFLNEEILMFDHLTSSPKVGKALQDLTLKANFKILEDCLEALDLQYPHQGINRLPLTSFSLAQPFWGSMQQGSPFRYVNSVISGCYIALNSTRFPNRTLQLAALSEFRRKLVPRTLFQEMARAIEGEFRKTFKLGRKFFAEAFDITGRKGYRVYFQFPANPFPSPPMEPQLLQARIGEEIKNILQEVLRRANDDCISTGLPPLSIRFLRCTDVSTASNTFKGPGLIAGIYFGLEDRPDKFVKIVRSFDPILGKD